MISRDTFEALGKELFASVGQSIGIHVLMLVLEHALWQTKQRYEEAGLIKYSEEGIDFSALNALEEDRATAVAHDFILAVIATLGKLIGMQIARQLTVQLNLQEEVGEA